MFHCDSLAITSGLISRILWLWFYFRFFFFFFGDIFSYCPVSSLLLSFIYVGAGSITTVYSLGHSGWLSDKFQMLQSWLSCKLCRIANLLAYAQHFIRLDSKCCESETYTVKLRLFSKEHLWIEDLHCDVKIVFKGTYCFIVSSVFCRSCFHSWAVYL